MNTEPENPAPAHAIVISSVEPWVAMQKILKSICHTIEKRLAGASDAEAESVRARAEAASFDPNCENTIGAFCANLTKILACAELGQRGIACRCATSQKGVPGAIAIMIDEKQPWKGLVDLLATIGKINEASMSSLPVERIEAMAARCQEKSREPNVCAVDSFCADFFAASCAVNLKIRRDAADIASQQSEGEPPEEGIHA